MPRPKTDHAPYLLGAACGIRCSLHERFQHVKHAQASSIGDLATPVYRLHPSQ